MQELIHNPEKFRIGDNYKASNVVFPVQFEGTKYTIKHARLLGNVIDAYYCLQDMFFYGNKSFSTSETRLSREAHCLKDLNGCNAPKLVAYEDGIVVREHLEGINLRELGDISSMGRAIRQGLDAMLEIHEKGISIGDTHVKNLIKRNGSVKWLDFEGAYREQDFLHSKAFDFIKFVYSTFTETRDADVTSYVAREVVKKIDDDVAGTISYFLDPGFSAARLWFPTRIPLDEKLNVQIKGILR